MTNLSFAHSE